jgi:uncharacterized protein
MNAKTLLRKYFSGNETGLAIVLEHSELVADKALRVARYLNDPALDLKFIEEAALLHDIGIVETNAPGIGCFGPQPYICHGLIGRKILEAEGFPRHAMVCERHIGVGLTSEDIAAQKLPLPLRSMVPISKEEKIVAFADLFFSKSGGSPEKTPEEVRRSLEAFGSHKVAIFEEWTQVFSP